jgi:hypothetical protein
MLHRFFAGLGVVAAAALSACANPVGEMADDPTHPASPSAPPAPAFDFSHSLEDAGGGPETGAEVAPRSGSRSPPGSQMDHDQHGAAAQ